MKLAPFFPFLFVWLWRLYVIGLKRLVKPWWRRS